ncbi:MAG: YfhO family protein, partial [Acidobacteriota bacterium]
PWYQPFLRRTPSTALPPGMATVTSYQPDRLTISVEARRPALMVLAENADPGWQVSVDGQPASWHRVNFNLRGLVVTTGHHQVQFVYRPVSIKIGAVISLITALILLLIIVRDPGRESRRPLRGADASASHPF